MYLPHGTNGPCLPPSQEHVARDYTPAPGRKGAWAMIHPSEAEALLAMPWPTAPVCPRAASGLIARAVCAIRDGSVDELLSSTAAKHPSSAGRASLGRASADITAPLRGAGSAQCPVPGAAASCASAATTTCTPAASLAKVQMVATMPQAAAAAAASEHGVHAMDISTSASNATASTLVLLSSAHASASHVHGYLELDTMTECMGDDGTYCERC